MLARVSETACAAVTLRKLIYDFEVGLNDFLFYLPIQNASDASETERGQHPEKGS